MNLLDLLFPKRCLGCGKWGRYVCSSCQEDLKPLRYLKCPVCEKPAIDGMTHPGCHTKYALDGLTSFFRYDNIVKKAIKKIKYRFAYDIVEELIDCIPVSLFSTFENIHKSYILNHKSIIMPIPLHSSRYNFRGFNQAEVIAQALRKRLNIPVKTNMLIRTKKTTPQVEMKDRDKRLANMKDVFSIPNSYLLPLNSGILIVDDVFTTGATLRSAGSILKHAGAKFVWGITIAQ
jgi:ComF family protein